MPVGFSGKPRTVYKVRKSYGKSSKKTERFVRCGDMKPKVQILTTPECSSCERVEGMLDKMKIEYEIIDITKNPEILEKYQVMCAPGIVINGKLEFTGVPDIEELMKKLKK